MNILYHSFLLLLIAVLTFGDRCGEAQPKDIEAANYQYTCPYASGRFANPYDCSEYWDCHTKDQLPTRHKCAPDTLYDEQTKQCLRNTLVTCGKRPGGITGSQCPGKPFECPSPNGRFPNDQDCSQYYECRNNIPQVLTCYAYQLYDVNTAHCQDHKTVNCGNRPGGEIGNKFVCPYQNGRFPNPNACSQYYECTNNVITLFTCLHFELYDINQKRCVDYRQVNCGNRPGGGKDYDYLCPSAYGRFENPYDCSQFYDCHTKGQRPTLYKCGPGTVFSVKSKQCMQASLVNCGNRPVGNKLVCPFPNGRFPHPNDCSQYFECKNNIPQLYQCYAYQLYDVNKLKCADYKQVNCENRPGGGKDYRYICPSAYGRFENPYDCSQFFDCHTKGQEPTLYTCGPGTVFSVKSKQCMQTSLVNCGNRPLVIVDKNKFVCPFPNGRFPNPYDCSQFFECVDNVPHLINCFPFTLFDFNKGECQDYRRVDCGKRPGGEIEYRYVCPTAFGRFENPYDCSEFYDCHTKGEVPSLHKCNPGTVFSVKSKQCMEASIVNCGNRPGGIIDRNRLVCPYPNGRFPNPSDCSQYFECYNNVPQLFQCPPFNLYDVNKLRCQDFKSVNCGNRPGGLEYRYTCPTAFGRFPNPFDCSEFFDCHTKDKLPSKHKCSPGTLFDDQKKQCIQDTLVTCGKRPGGITDLTTTTTTTPVPTTTTTTPVPTTTTTTPVPTTTTTTTPVPTTTTTTPVPTTTTTTPVPTTTTTTPVPTTTTTTTTVAPTTVSNKKPNTPPPTDCDDEDIDCIEDKTKDDITGWFECPAQYGHFPHTGHIQLFIHCDNWHPFIKRCGPHTRFSPTNLVCVHMGNNPIPNRKK